jgi:putative hydrolase of the HAD superfamily
VIKYAIWDLDNTLYSPETGIFSEIKLRSLEILRRLTDDCDKKEKEYISEYGSVYYGLVNEHPDIMEDIIGEIFDIQVDKYISTNNELIKNRFSELHTSNILFTHAPMEFAKNTLNVLGISEFFNDIFDGRRLNFLKKSDEVAQNKLLNELKINSKECVMIEDTLSNLKASKIVGMTTILITWGKEICDPDNLVDIYVEDTISAILTVKSISN